MSMTLGEAVALIDLAFEGDLAEPIAVVSEEKPWIREVPTMVHEIRLVFGDHVDERYRKVSISFSQDSLDSPIGRQSVQYEINAVQKFALPPSKKAEETHGWSKAGATRS
jgi:hypothetical protein